MSATNWFGVARVVVVVIVAEREIAEFHGRLLLGCGRSDRQPYVDILDAIAIVVNAIVAIASRIVI